MSRSKPSCYVDHTTEAEDVDRTASLVRRQHFLFFVYQFFLPGSSQ
jgi:hypothetical protein